ncbi:MAG: hypothetical protein J6104_04920 [Methanomicrobium sp.]|nr:hypothetical protein [Methanomicrobium sp.]
MLSAEKCRPTIVRRYFLISARHVGFRDGHGNGGDRNLRQDVQKRKNKKNRKKQKKTEKSRKYQKAENAKKAKKIISLWKLS